MVLRRWVLLGLGVGWLGSFALPHSLTAQVVDEPLSVAAESIAETVVPSAGAVNLASFDKVWTSIRDTHWDASLGGLDWEACRDELRPNEEEASDIRTVRIAMSKLMGRLKQSHFVVIPREMYESDSEAAVDESVAEDQIESPDKPGAKPAAKPAAKTATSQGMGGWTGFEFRFADGLALVTSVEKGSPADTAGILAGQVIVEVDGSKVLSPEELVESEKIAERVAREVAYSKLMGQLVGPVGEDRKLTVESLDGMRMDVTLTLGAEPGEMIGFGNLPKMNLRMETRMIEPANVGFISFSIFLDPSQVISRIGEFVKQHPDANGIVIDVRGNPGGIGAMAGGIAGWFAQEPQESLGTMFTRTGKMKFIAFKQQGAFAGPVALLVDDRSMSTSEIFASGMQLTGRARVFGQQSAGAALPSMIEVLPNGDRFLHAFASIEDLEGNGLEGRGVVPDQVVELDRQTLAAGKDPVLEAALEWIEKQAEK